MRICILGRSDYLLLQERVKNLISLLHDVHIVTLDAGNDSTDSFGTVHHIATSSKLGTLKYVQAIPHFRQLINRIKPDVVDIHGISSYGIYGLAPLKTIPFVSTVYGPDINIHGRQNRLLAMLMRRCIQNSDMVYGSTPAAHDYIQEVLDIDVADKFKARSWGLNVSEINSSKIKRRTRIRSEFSIEDDTRIILHNRQFTDFWRVTDILESIPELLSSYPNVEFWFVFPPPNQEGENTLQKARQQIERLGIQAHVRLLGPQPYERMISIMHASDIYLCMGQSDLLASSVLEALATGLVPVLNNLQAYHEVINHGENGFFLESVEPESVSQSLADVIAKFSLYQPRFAERNLSLISQKYDSHSNTAWLVDQFEILASNH